MEKSLLIDKPPKARKATAVNDHEEFFRKFDFNFKSFATNLNFFENLMQKMMRHLNAP